MKQLFPRLDEDNGKLPPSDDFEKKLRVQYILIEHHELVSMFAKSFLNGQSLNVLGGGSLDNHGLTF